MTCPGSRKPQSLIGCHQELLDKRPKDIAAFMDTPAQGDQCSYIDYDKVFPLIR